MAKLSLIQEARNAQGTFQFAMSNEEAFLLRVAVHNAAFQMQQITRSMHVAKDITHIRKASSNTETMLAMLKSIDACLKSFVDEEYWAQVTREDKVT